MKQVSVLIAGAIISWGLWGFFSKLAATRIGIQASFWNSISISVFIIAFLAITGSIFPVKMDRNGIIFALASGIFSGIASILFFILLGKRPVGFLIAITSLYPIITIILSVIFLKEPINFYKLAGFVFAMLAIIFLNL